MLALQLLERVRVDDAAEGGEQQLLGARALLGVQGEAGQDGAAQLLVALTQR